MNNTVTKFIAIVWLSLLGSLTLATAQQVEIEGYSPVSYFTKGIAEKGSPEFAATYEEKTYYLASQEQLDMFNADPEHFAPRFGAYCAFSLQEGRVRQIDPTQFKIVADSLLLFHKGSGLDGKKKWNKGDDRNQLNAAAASFTILVF